MPQLAVTLNLDGLDAEVVEAACFAAGALAITYRDLRDDAILEPAPGEFRLWPHSQLEALFPFEASPLELVTSIAGALDIPAARVRLHLVADRVWEREWLKDFRPMRFGQRLWVAPHGSDVPDARATIVRLDPGLAFGTGTHPTTAMCLEWLDANVTRGIRAIDYGCGSGVLALAAGKLGAAQVQAFDIDPQALTATRDNAAANDLLEAIHVVGSAEELAPGADIVMANILAGPLCELAPALSRLVRPHGRLILAGLLSTQAAEVASAYASAFEVTEFKTRDGWTSLAAVRRSTMQPTV
jgi:ribosomal protein L11 methyltransferase